MGKRKHLPPKYVVHIRWNLCDTPVLNEYACKSHVIERFETAGGKGSVKFGPGVTILSHTALNRTSKEWAEIPDSIVMA